MEYTIEQAPKIKVVFGEKNFMLRKPTMKDQLVLEEKLREATDNKKSMMPPMLDWIKSLGLPQDVVDTMDPDEFVKLFQFLTGVKKK